MGWDNWNAFGCSVSEDLLLGTAQKIVYYGLRDLGYQYVILDDCWSAGRSSNGTLLADLTKFPNGMAHVADQLHSMGLKFGMYSSAGYYTCGRYAGSLSHETQDAQTFADWGVDYLKYDNCYNGGQAGTQMFSYNRYDTMSQALNKTGRPILYSMCNWGEDSPWNWAQTMANSWRMSGDIYDSFSRPDVRCPCTGDEGYDCALPGFHCSVLNIMNKMASIQSKTQSGAESDMDMLEVGNGGQTDDEYKTHFSMWALNASPLIIGTDIRSMTPASLSIYSNPAVIALNQDSAVSAAVRHWRYYVSDVDEYGMGEISMWTRTLNNSDVAVALVNAGNNSRTMNATLAEIFFDNGAARSPEAKIGYDVYDLWGYRMDNATATNVLNGTSGPINGNSTTRYNSTAMSYADGLAMNSTALLGNRTGSVPPLGTLTAMVPRHGVGLFRLRAQPAGMKKRDEL
ncbi:hypothetical protein MMC11_002842 [Xylographa trunciseda]|nr:hypothetical protein [Xylographa trunciseda]